MWAMAVPMGTQRSTADDGRVALVSGLSSPPRRKGDRGSPCCPRCCAAMKPRILDRLKDVRGGWKTKRQMIGKAMRLGLANGASEDAELVAASCFQLCLVANSRLQTRLARSLHEVCPKLRQNLEREIAMAAQCSFEPRAISCSRGPPVNNASDARLGRHAIAAIRIGVSICIAIGMKAERRKCLNFLMMHVPVVALRHPSRVQLTTNFDLTSLIAQAHFCTDGHDDSNSNGDLAFIAPI
ncbi:hypothetical protein L1887_51739 [Cichorium endivia]|nr:hypothetical protein L1887_51739 [Cichorium endivia]